MKSISLLLATIVLATMPGCESRKTKPAVTADAETTQDCSLHVEQGHGGGEAATETEPGLSLGIESVPNLRELGGYETADGKKVATGLLYRSNQLHKIPPADMQKIAALGLKTDFDFRTAAERQPRPDELPEGVKEVWLDVLADADDAGPAQLEQLMKDAKAANQVLGGGKAAAEFAASYRQFVTLPSAKKAFSKLFMAVGDEKQLPALFHCTTDKDRTGWAAAALLSLLGVPKETIYEDYLRSNDYILPMYQKVIDRFAAAGGEKEIPTALLGVRKEYLDAAFDEMEKNYGTIENYFSDALGIDATAQKNLRDLYLVQE
jgi:protein-tyrosine phosphatase